ncbi:MAG: hypothetical protein WDZ76_08020 [Pseudohongiellaceae bacterium]
MANRIPLTHIVAISATSLLAALIAPRTHADQPLGWISSGNDAAYTLGRNEVELSLAGLLINDTLDFLDVREDLLKSNDNLTGDTGDLTGTRFELQYGLTSWLTLFYQRQQHDLTVQLGEISSAQIEDLDDALSTTRQEYGIKWTIYQGRLLNGNNHRRTATLQLSGFDAESDDFGVVISELYFPNLTIRFRDPQTFSVTQLEDKGWTAKLLLSLPLTNAMVATFWGGYSDSEATSATTSDLTAQPVASYFEQSFRLDESFFRAGASLNWQLRPRLPISLSYEFIKRHDNHFTATPTTPPVQLPGFLRSRASPEDSNHTLTARASWWLTPHTHISLTGNLYSNQFLGILPHYNNPLSGSFSDNPYGFAGLQLGFRF